MEKNGVYYWIIPVIGFIITLLQLWAGSVFKGYLKLSRKNEENINRNANDIISVKQDNKKEHEKLRELIDVSKDNFNRFISERCISAIVKLQIENIIQDIKEIKNGKNK